MTKGKILLWALASTAFTVPASAQGGDAGRAADEIVVTARRRAEGLQDVPIAVSAISGVALEKAGVTQTRELFASTPGLYFSQTGQRQNDEQFYLTIRGVGSSPVVEPLIPIFGSIRPTWKPGASASTRNAEMPEWPAVGSVFANTV